MLRNPRFFKHNQAPAISLILAAMLSIGCACRLFSPPAPTFEGETAPAQQTVDEETTSPSTETTATPSLETPTNAAKTLSSQWAISAADRNSSEEALNVIGPPDSEGCELTPRESVWVYQSDAPPVSTSYLQVFYDQPVLPAQVKIYLAYDFSAIVRVSVIDLEGQPHRILEDEPNNLFSCPSVLTLEIDDVNLPVYAVRIDVETTRSDLYGLTAVDAVELIGEPLPGVQPTPVPTPYLTMSSLGFNAADVQEGFVYFEVIDNNSEATLTFTLCDGFSYNVTESERTIRFFSCDDQTEVWLYAPRSLEIGSVPLNSYPLFPSARLWINDHYIPAMEGELWIDRVSTTHITGVLEFKGFDPENQVDYYRVVAVFNQIPLTEEAARKPGELITQWGQQAEASSERSPDEFAADQAAGPSDTWENCELAVTTWKPAATDSQPWLEVYFEQPVSPTVLNILFSGSPESFLEINLLSETDYFPLDLGFARVLDGCPQALTFDSFASPPIDIVGVQIMLNPAEIGDGFGLDAVQLIGVIGN